MSDRKGVDLGRRGGGRNRKRGNHGQNEEEENLFSVFVVAVLR